VVGGRHEKEKEKCSERGGTNQTSKKGQLFTEREKVLRPKVSTKKGSHFPLEKGVATGELAEIVSEKKTRNYA